MTILHWMWIIWTGLMLLTMAVMTYFQVPIAIWMGIWSGLMLLTVAVSVYFIGYSMGRGDERLSRVRSEEAKP